MAERLLGINPAILIWARVRSGRSVEDVAQALGRKTELVKAWEMGNAAPTYTQLEKLAYVLYKRPLALFFFPQVPDEPDPKSAFRTLPDLEIDQLLPTTRFKMREAQSLQLSLRELTEGVNPATEIISKDLRTTPAASTTAVATRVRSYLGVSLKTQAEVWGSVEDALKGWRSALEGHGIFIFKAAFRQDDVSGFCLFDVEFPVIWVNNSAPDTRQIFTYFHELAHILLGTGGVTKLDDSYIHALRGENRAIEVFCNRFAGDFLLPRKAFMAAASEGNPLDDEFVANLARRFKVSRETVLRRFLDQGQVIPVYYEEKAAQWRQQAKEARKARREKKGGDYYKTQATYLGEKYMRLAFRRYYEGAITLNQLADHLNINPRNVSGLEEQIIRKAVG